MWSKTLLPSASFYTQLYKNDQHLLGTVKTEVSADFHDLSLEHAPLGCLTGNIADPGEWEKFKLTPEQVEKYWTDGYLSNIPVLSEEQCDKLLEDYKTFLVSGYCEILNFEHILCLGSSLSIVWPHEVELGTEVG